MRLRSVTAEGVWGGRLSDGSFRRAREILEEAGPYSPFRGAASPLSPPGPDR